MNLRYSSTLSPPSNFISPVRAVAYSPNGKHLLTVNSGNTINVYDERGAFKEQFTPKPSDKVCFIFLCFLFHNTISLRLNILV